MVSARNPEANKAPQVDFFYNIKISIMITFQICEMLSFHIINHISLQTRGSITKTDIPGSHFSCLLVPVATHPHQRRAIFGLITLLLKSYSM